VLLSQLFHLWWRQKNIEFSITLSRTISKIYEVSEVVIYYDVGRWVMFFPACFNRKE
jgi:hypothetical protein